MPRTGCRMRAVVMAAALVLAPAGASAAGPRQPAVDPGGNRFEAYRADANPREDIAAAKKRAAASGKLVMVTFGANWCADCLALHRNLAEPATREYAQKAFEFVNVDVGDDGKKNLDVAADLGVSTKKGIPVAVFLMADGRPVGNTNRGELEPSRKYSSTQILAFLREVAERRTIIAPDGRVLKAE